LESWVLDLCRARDRRSTAHVRTVRIRIRTLECHTCTYGWNRARSTFPAHANVSCVAWPSPAPLDRRSMYSCTDRDRAGAAERALAFSAKYQPYSDRVTESSVRPQSSFLIGSRKKKKHTDTHWEIRIGLRLVAPTPITPSAATDDLSVYPTHF
jgi:hypothetical protein